MREAEDKEDEMTREKEANLPSEAGDDDNKDNDPQCGYILIGINKLDLDEGLLPLSHGSRTKKINKEKGGERAFKLQDEIRLTFKRENVDNNNFWVKRVEADVIAAISCQALSFRRLAGSEPPPSARAQPHPLRSNSLNGLNHWASEQIFLPILNNCSLLFYLIVLEIHQSKYT